MSDSDGWSSFDIEDNRSIDTRINQQHEQLQIRPAPDVSSSSASEPNSVSTLSTGESNQGQNNIMSDNSGSNSVNTHHSNIPPVPAFGMGGSVSAATSTQQQQQSDQVSHSIPSLAISSGTSNNNAAPSDQSLGGSTINTVGTIPAAVPVFGAALVASGPPPGIIVPATGGGHTRNDDLFTELVHSRCRYQGYWSDLPHGSKGISRGTRLQV